MEIINVSPSGANGFSSICEAVAALPRDGGEIRVAEGIYREKVWINTNNVRLIGSGAEKTVIIYDDHALKTDENGEQYGTFKSWTVKVTADDFFCCGLSIVNNAGMGNAVGQAVALSVTGDRCRFSDCFFNARQDTLFTGPENLDDNGGPDDFPRRMLFENCRISGDVDFIFGSATAFFKECDIVSKNRNMEPNGYITANSTNSRIKYGYVFERCRLLGEEGIQSGSVFLGRPWRRHSAAVFINCEMDAHIAPAGWDNWRNPENEKTVRYGEHGSTGAGADTEERVSWAKKMNKNQADEYSIERVLTSWAR